MYNPIKKPFKTKKRACWWLRSLLQRVTFYTALVILVIAGMINF